MFVAVMGAGRFGHAVAATRCVGPIGAVAVQLRTEEPGEQRFCEDQRLKQPMGLPFSEWADYKILPSAGRLKSVGGVASRSYLTEITVDRPSVTSDFGYHRWESNESLFRHLQQSSTAFSSNTRESKTKDLA